MAGGFNAGTYTATYATAVVGQTKDGFKIEHQVFKRIVTGDQAAETPQDGIFRGMTMFADLTLLEYSAAGAAACFWPYGASYLSMAAVGRTDMGNSAASISPLAGALVLTALTGTPAATLGPVSLTLTNAILAEGFPVSLLFAPDLREIPVRMRAYPHFTSISGGVPAYPMLFGTLT